jgi:hypothetical protein
VDLPKIVSGNAKFWIYKDVELPNTSGKKQKYPAFLALVDDNGIRKAMTGAISVRRRLQVTLGVDGIRCIRVPLEERFVELAGRQPAGGGFLNEIHRHRRFHPNGARRAIVAVISIDADEDRNAAILEDYHVVAFPTFVLIDRAGKVAAYQIGYEGEETLRSLLEKSGLR